MIVFLQGDFVQVYHLPSSQSSHASLLVEARVAGQPTSLLYLQKVSRFVGWFYRTANKATALRPRRGTW